MPISIVIADDHQILRSGLKSLLEREPDIVVIGEAEDGLVAVRLVAELRPDVVIMDVSMPELNGIDATRQITEKFADVRVLALSMHRDRRFVAGMFRAGASGFLLKDCAFEELINAIRKLAVDSTYVGSGIADIVIEDYVQRLAGSDSRLELTHREQQVLELLAEGKSTKEVAGLLVVSVKTIESHRKQIMDKLNLHSIAELTKYAISKGLTSVEP